MLKDWITSDPDLVVNVWTLVGFKLVNKVKLTRPPSSDPNVKNSVIEVQALTHLNLILVGTLDGIISAHTAKEWNCVVTFSLGSGNLVALEYSEEFRVFFAAGCENSVRVLSLTTKHHELAMVGKLTGHSHLIVAIKPLEGTSLAVTCDEKGFIKLWDIRKLICVQTLRLPNATGISSIVSIDKSKVAFVGERFNVMEFEKEEAQEGLTTASKNLQNLPIGVAACHSTQRFLLVTNHDVKSIDMKTGRITHVFAKVVDPDDKVITWVQDQRRNRFMIGTSNGRITIHDLETTELLRESQPHSGEVSGLHIDPKSQGVVSCGLDCQLNIFHDAAKEVELAKEVDQSTSPQKTEEENFFKQPMFFEDDGHAGFQKYKAEIIKQAITQEGAVQQERRQTKLRKTQVASIETIPPLELIRQIRSCNEETSITLMKISLHHNIVALSSAANKVYLYNYEYARPLAVIQFPESSKEITTMAFFDGYSKLLVGADPSKLFLLGLFYLSAFKIEVTHEQTIDMTSFCFREMKSPTHASKNLTIDLHITQSDSHELEAPRLALMHPKSAKLGYCDVYLSNTIDSIDYIIRLDFAPVLSGQVTYDNASSHPHYNPSRRGFEDFKSSDASLKQSLVTIQEETPAKKTAEPVVKKAFRAARGPISSIAVWHAKDTLLLVTAADRTFRIFTPAGEMLSLLQLAYHLPTKWNLPTTMLKNKRGELLLAIQTVERLNQRHPDTVLTSSLSTKKILKELTKLVPIISKAPSIENFRTFSLTGVEQEGPSKLSLQSLKTVSLFEEDPKPTTVVQLVTAEDKPSHQVVLLKEVYSEKDLAYEQIKAENREQIAGPTLRQLEYIRRAKSKDPLAELASRADKLKMAPTKKKTTNTNPMAAYFGKLEMENPLKELVKREQFLKSMAGKIDHQFSQIDEDMAKAREASLSRMLQREVSFTLDKPNTKGAQTVKSKSRRVSFVSQSSMQLKRLKSDASIKKTGSQTTRTKVGLNLADVPATPMSGRISIHPGMTDSNAATGRSSLAAVLNSPAPPQNLPRLNFSSALLRLPSNVIVEETSQMINLTSVGDASSMESKILQPASKSKLKSSTRLQDPKIDMFSYALEKNLYTMSTEQSKFKTSMISSTKDHSASERKNYLSTVQGQETSNGSLADRRMHVSSEGIFTHQHLQTEEGSGFQSEAKLTQEATPRAVSPKNERRVEQQRFHMILKSLHDKVTKSKSKIPFAGNVSGRLHAEPVATEFEKKKVQTKQPVKVKKPQQTEALSQDQASFMLEPIVPSQKKKSEPMQLSEALALIEKEIEEVDNLELRFQNLKNQQRSKLSSPRKQQAMNRWMSMEKRKLRAFSPSNSKPAASRSQSPEGSVLPKLNKP